MARMIYDYTKRYLKSKFQPRSFNKNLKKQLNLLPYEMAPEELA
jgi:hypothetical protein